jgi:predicted DNA-binding transcriptional regulator AlpA
MPSRHHLDRRANKLVAESAGADPDELLDTKAVADWFGVSEQWLEIGRIKKYGPKFKQMSPRVVRYRRGDVLAWLKRRTYSCTSEYSPSARRKDRRLKGDTELVA